MKTTSFEVSDKLYLVRQEVPSGAAAAAKPAELPTNHVAVIDCSGSMYSELPKIREQLKKRLPKVLKEKDTLSVVWFSGRGQCGVLLEAEPVATLTDLKVVETAIDRWLRPTGMTGFKEPLEEVEKLAGRLSKKNDSPIALVFMSDGCDNQWQRGDILKAAEKAAGAVQSVTVMEYGYYADRPLLTAIAEKAGGQLVFTQDFESYAPAFEAVVQKRQVGGKKVELKVEGDAIRGFAWAMDGTDLTTFAVEGGAVRVPESTGVVYYMSSRPVGEVGRSVTEIAEGFSRSL
jgi:hypothetical protein